MDGLLLLGDAIESLKSLAYEPVHLIIADLPYGTTESAWDVQLELAPLWAEFDRLLTPTGTAIFTATQPFTTDLINCRREMFKYTLVWEKTRATLYVHAKNRPLREFEDIVVFSRGSVNHASVSDTRMTYNPQGTIPVKPRDRAAKSRGFATGRGRGGLIHASPSNTNFYEQSETNFPRSILRFTSAEQGIHPNLKPIALFEYLIRTYSNPGDTVLDPTCGAGTTALACIRSGRRYICIEREEKYFQIAQRRIDADPLFLFETV